VVSPEPVRALFVNSGILGQRTFAHFIESEFVGDREGIRATQIVLTDGLSLDERLMRRLLCLRLWPAGFGGRHNLDFLRYRAEWNAGITARRRIRRLESSGERFDVLHFHRQTTAYASLGRIRATPTIVSIDCTQACALQSARTALERFTLAPNIRRDGRIFAAARLVISTSQWAADRLRAEYPRCATEITVMPNPVRLDLFDPAWAQARRAIAATGDRMPHVLFMGGDFPRKGGYDLLAAWREGRFGQRAILDLVTSWPVEADKLSAGVHIHPNITALSPDWRAIWRDADLFVLPTHDEAFGIVFQEAAAAGLPAVGTRLNAIPEIVRDGTTGLLVPPGDRRALIAAIEQLLASSELRRDMGMRARERIAESADPQTYRRRLAAAVHRLAGR
jgi:starch synthase